MLLDKQNSIILKNKQGGGSVSLPENLMSFGANANGTLVVKWHDGSHPETS